MERDKLKYMQTTTKLACSTRAAVVHLNLRAGLTFQVLVCTVSPRLLVNKAGTQ